ncbi:MAG: hypothetical protein WCH05_05830 [Chlorobiaceae bacterium]
MANENNGVFTDLLISVGNLVQSGVDLAIGAATSAVGTAGQIVDTFGKTAVSVVEGVAKSATQAVEGVAAAMTPKK